MPQLLYLLVAALYCWVSVLAAPTPSPLGVRFEERSLLPTVTFADATYRASKYDLVNDVGLLARLSRLHSC